MALEFHIITSCEFFRVGAHGELDWPQSLEVLGALVSGFVERGTDRAMVDLRDVRMDLSEEQKQTLAGALKKIGVRKHHRIAILFAQTTPRRPPVFVNAARKRGYDVERFYNYEQAVEWLSRVVEEDPDFDREIYRGPTGEKKQGPPRSS